ncbi:MAG: DNA-directed RNA polymerase subunit omega [Clostridia bacterium]|nr:DNA-directed RNA polymerase subunit omega [Clostridia bacterium]
MVKLNVLDMINGKANKFPLAMAVARRMRGIGEEIDEDTRKITKKPIIVAFEELKDQKYEVYMPESNDERSI